MSPYQEAINAGYTPEEIKAAAYKKYPAANIDDALKEGYSLDEVLSAAKKKYGDGSPKTHAEKVMGRVKEKGFGSEFGQSIKSIGKALLGQGTREELQEQVGEEFAKFPDIIGEIALAEAGMRGIGGPLAGKLASKGVPQTAARLTGMGTTGAAVNAAESLSKGELPSPSSMGEHGVIWAAIDAALMRAGKIGSFGAQFVKALRNYKGGEEELAAEVSKRVKASGVNMQDTEAVANAADKALADIEAEFKFPKRAEEVAYEEALAKQEAEKEAFTRAEKEKLTQHEQMQQDVTQRMEEFKPMESKESAGKAIQQDIEAQRAKAREAEGELYNPIQEASSGIQVNTKAPQSVAKKVLQDVGQVKVTPTGYTNVKGHIQDVVADLEGPITLSKLIEVGRRLNKIIDYEVLEPHVKNLLKPIKNSVKKEIGNVLAKENKSLFNKWVKAEAMHADNAQKFGTDAIRKIRGEESVEKIAAKASAPTPLKEMKQILTPEGFKTAERALLDDMHQATEKKAMQILRENRKYMSQEARKLADDIIASKRKPVKGKLEQQKLKAPEAEPRLNTTVKNEITDFVSAGKPPAQTLKLWSQPKGRDLVNKQIDQLPKPQQDKIKKALSKQSAESKLDAITDKKGRIDSKKFGELAKDKTFIKDIHELLGNEGVEVVRKAEKAIEHIQKNTKFLRKTTDIVENMEEAIGLQSDLAKGALIFGKIVGITGALGPVGAALSWTSFLSHISKSPAIRKAWANVASSASPQASVLFVRALEKDKD